METGSGAAQGLSRRRNRREDMVRAAAAVLAEYGVDGLTMARVAAEIKVTPMALYQHVADKSHLLGLTLDSVLQEVEVPGETFGTWDERLRRLHLDVSRAMTKFPGLVAASKPPGEEVPRLLEGYLQILLDGGFDPLTAASAYTGLFYLAMGTQYSYPAGAPTPAAVLPDDPQKYPATATTARALARETTGSVMSSAGFCPGCLSRGTPLRQAHPRLLDLLDPMRSTR